MHHGLQTVCCVGFYEKMHGITELPVLLMELDETKIDEAVLALLYLTLSHKDHRAWKSF